MEKIDKLNISEEGFGLLLGAGASYCAGYPLMNELTKKTLSILDEIEYEFIASLVQEQTGGILDRVKGVPNIEIINDLLESRMITIGESSESEKIEKLIEKIRGYIVEHIYDIRRPDLNTHIKLFKSLKKIYEGKSCPIWIFTTNYDLVLEYAASIAGIPLYDGFHGSSLRYLDVSSFKLVHGNYLFNGKSQVFKQHQTPYINLVKLHGSINWWINEDGKAFSSDEKLYFSENLLRTMILPRRTKVREVLATPYDSLWRIANDVIGTECKYITSLGYSYGDHHINETLLIPKLKGKQIVLNAFARDMTEPLKEFTQFKNVNIGTNEMGSNFWDFQIFVERIAEYAGFKEGEK